MSVDHANPLAQQALEILCANDTGDSMQPAPSLYPHQWSWDSALIAVGLAEMSIDRAVQEFRSLLRGQWKNGMIPQIQFRPEIGADAYFPDADRWDSSIATDAPADVSTSGIIQPPVHALALHRIVQRCPHDRAQEIAREFYPALKRWHQYLMSARDPENSGLITIVHPWESGMDNSPRWDTAMARIQVPEDDLPPYTRRDLDHVSDPAMRPTAEDYDRFLWIVEVLKRGDYRVDRIYHDLPFRVKDVFVSSIMVAANESLVALANLAEADLDDFDAIASWIDLGRRGLAESWDDETGRCLDLDLISGERIDVDTIALLSPIIAGQLAVPMRERLIALWKSEKFVGAEGLRWPLPPSTCPNSPAFQPRRYWRGPVWPVMSWLFWSAWQRLGEHAIAEHIRWHSLDQISTSGFYEYLHPMTGEGLGSANQSWTAAAVLSWLSDA